MKKFLITLLAVMGIAVGAVAADKPQFPGGQAALDKYITENMKYPQAAKDNGIEGVVGVVFTVKADGTIGTTQDQADGGPGPGGRGHTAGEGDAEMGPR